MIAYHFTADTLRDGRPVPPVGEWLVHDGPVEMYKSGLHWSRHPFDALTYAPDSGPLYLHRDEVDDVVEEIADRGVSMRRKILASIDAEPLCREFARWCALQVIELWDAPDVVREYLETGDESIRVAAKDAAWATAWDASWGADRSVAGAVAWAAITTAARSAARSASWAVAKDAARSASWNASWGAVDVYREKFAEMVDAAFAEAA
jgi:hypothetical protein